MLRSCKVLFLISPEPILHSLCNWSERRNRIIREMRVVGKSPASNLNSLLAKYQWDKFTIGCRVVCWAEAINCSKQCTNLSWKFSTETCRAMYELHHFRTIMRSDFSRLFSCFRSSVIGPRLCAHLSTDERVLLGRQNLSIVDTWNII
jgi:hypothetical protein